MPCYRLALFTMVRHALLAALAATATTALTLGRREATGELFTIETAPGETQRVDEATKWALKAVGPAPGPPRLPRRPY